MLIFNIYEIHEINRVRLTSNYLNAKQLIICMKMLLGTR